MSGSFADKVAIEVHAQWLAGGFPVDDVAAGKDQISRQLTAQQNAQQGKRPNAFLVKDHFFIL